MASSLALRCSSGMAHRTDNTHKRGRSLESGLTVRAKDDDLALFSDMEDRERDNFLLHDSDDFNDSLSKLRYFSGFKLDKITPARGELSDPLNAEGEKNDYDWLLTPPDTPLFHSLDDDEPQPQNMRPRGRPQSQPIKILRSSSIAEKTHRMSITSSSPHRLSPSPHSNTSLTQLKARPSSAPRAAASPPLVLRPTTPSRRSSTPPNKPSTPTPRPSTPTLRRMSAGSSGHASSSGRRPASPMKSSRGNSASPKISGWQADLPGFSSDAPPNLRTSLSDWSVPRVRGMSPTPRSGRQSMSPTASRSASSFHSNERDNISSFSRGSVVSSGDDVDSLHSATISSTPTTRRNGVAGNSRPTTSSKKPSRTSSSSSVPKRSFDSALRQMEHRKTPQSMFRPLLSVPATTFYIGKVNSMHRPMFSRNSSLTTSTSASSEQGNSIAPDMEGSEHDQNDLTVEWERTEDPDTHEDLFIFDKPDDIVEGSGHNNFAGVPPSGSTSCNESMTCKLNSQERGNSMVNFRETTSTTITGEPTCSSGYCSSGNCLDDSCPTQLMMDHSEVHLSDYQLDYQPELGATQSDRKSKCEQMEHTANLNHRVENPEGTGISVLLLQRSSSSKWPVVQGRVFYATNIPCSDPSYVRDNTSATAMRRTIGRDSASASSSMDLGSSRQAEVHVQDQFSSMKSGVFSIRCDSDAKNQCTGTHSDIIAMAYEPSFHPNTETEDKFNNSIKSTEDEALRESVQVTEEQDDSFCHADSATDFSSIRRDLVDDSASVKHSCCMTSNTSDLQLWGHLENIHYDSFSADIFKDEALFPCIVTDQDPANANGRSTQDTEAPNNVRESFVVEEQCVLSGPACQSDICGTATSSDSLLILESQKDGDDFQDPETEAISSEIPSTVEFSHEHSVSTTSEEGVSNSIAKSCILDHAHEESTVLMEGPRGQTSRSLTLAEATDSILFCSSIVHDIVYNATTIGMEKELMMPSVTHRPTVTLVGKSVIEQKDLRSMPYKRTPKSQKFRRKMFDTQTKSPLQESGNSVVVGPKLSSAEIPDKNVDSTKPQKLESKCNCTVM